MKTLLAATLTAATVLIAAPATASSDAPCVSRSEFAGLGHSTTRAQIEREWGVTGTARWQGNHSDPGHDAYAYSLCGTDSAGRANLVRVTYERHTRVWSFGQLKVDGTIVKATTRIN